MPSVLLIFLWLFWSIVGKLFAPSFGEAAADRRAPVATSPPDCLQSCRVMQGRALWYFCTSFAQTEHLHKESIYTTYHCFFKVQHDRTTMKLIFQGYSNFWAFIPINGSSHFVRMFNTQSLWIRAKVAVDCSGDDVCRLVLWALNGLLLCVVHGVKKCYLLLRQGFMGVEETTLFNSILKTLLQLWLVRFEHRHVL